MAALLSWNEAESVVMAKLTPEQEAQYALKWNVSRSDLTTAAQHEYDRLRADDDRRAAAAREAAAAAYEAAIRASGWVPGNYVPPMNGDEVRNTWFMHGGGGNVSNYLASDVDGLLCRVAAELDARRPAGPLIEMTTFRTATGKKTYDIDAVDWFLDQLLPQDPRGRAGTSAGPWCDANDVAKLVPGGVSGLAECYSRSKPTWNKAGAWFAGQCQNAWRDFGQLPGTRLWWGPVGPAFCELRTADRQTLASLGYGWQLPIRPRPTKLTTVTIPGGRSFSYKKAAVRLRSAPDSWPPGVADIAARSWRDSVGHFTAATMTNSKHREEARRVCELLDETDTPILYTSGQNFYHRAYACVTFPDGRLLRFPVRGTRKANAIMTAVDQTGNKVARYRIIDAGPGLRETLLTWSRPVEVTVNPGWELTDELVLAIAVSADWLSSYFDAPG